MDLIAPKGNIRHVLLPDNEVSTGLGQGPIPRESSCAMNKYGCIPDVPQTTYTKATSQCVTDSQEESAVLILRTIHQDSYMFLCGS